MYTTRQKSCRDENQKPSRKTHKTNTPSFSSTLLDEIYRSTDSNSENARDFKAYKEKPAEKQSAGSFRRACLVEKWMEYDENEKKADEAKRAQLLQLENDLQFFSSTSSSSDSSGALSSSDTEFFGSQTKKPKAVSCFSTRPKPVRTGPAQKSKEESNSFDDYQNNHKKKLDGDDLIKSESTALKFYANLKKVKQPISPGVRLTTFINSLFNNGINSKKSKNVEPSKELRDLKSPKNVALSSTCSSASSFSKSCMSKYSPRSREKIRNNGIQRTVRFHPVSVIVDEDSRPCGQKSIINDENFDKYGRKPPLYPHALDELKLSKKEKNRKFEEDTQNVLKGYNSQRIINDISNFRKIQDEDNEDEFDGMSDSSSDLFEIDHLAFFGNNRFCEELPVYETTHFETNRAIASGLIR